LKNEEDSQVSVLFNEEPGATQSQKFYDGAEDSLQKENRKMPGRLKIHLFMK